MAYTRRTASRARGGARTTVRRRGSAGSRTTRTRGSGTKRRTASGTRSTGRKAAPQTIRLVIETAPSNPVARPFAASESVDAPKKSQF